MATYLVCGGAGYIGSHMCKHLHEAGHQVVVCDDLSTGHAEALLWGEHAYGAIEDASFLRSLFSRYQFDGVLHFAALSSVAESMRHPQRYYRNNVAATLNLLRVMRDFDVSKFVFSSTAAVFGEPQSRLISEDHPTVPLNPYGLSKLMVEQILRDSCRAYGLRAVALRYFNAAGADPAARIGEAHDPETHLIPKLVRKALGEDIQISINGTDYPTEDGTCVRDYIHVDDLAQAHLLALDHLDQAVGMHSFNLGNGTGYSVKQVINAVCEVTGRQLHIPTSVRRAGDPSHLVAASKLARAVLGWQPRYERVEDVIESAVRWHASDTYATWMSAPSGEANVRRSQRKASDVVQQHHTRF